MNLAPVIRQRYFSQNGVPLAGGKLYSYQAGTTTPQATYTDSSGGTPNANPVILDANGEANVWLDPSLSYKFILKDSLDVQQWVVDSVIGALIANSVTTAAIQDGAVTRAKLAVGASAGLVVVSKTANFTASITEDVYICNAVGGSFTATLPTSVGNSGKIFTIKRTDSTLANTLTVHGNGAETIDGSNILVLYTVGESITIISDGANWQLLDHKCGTSTVSYTPTLSNSTNVTTNAGFYRRSGDCLEIDIALTWSGAGGGSALTISLPSGVTIDSSRLTSATIGTGDSVGSGYWFYAGTDAYDVQIEAAGSTTVALYAGGRGFGTNVPGTAFLNGHRLRFNAKVPITGWFA